MVSRISTKSQPKRLELIYFLLSPIPPGATFIYEIPTDLQEGTYWIHGHYNGLSVSSFCS